MTITIKKTIENLTAGREDAGMIPEEEYTQTIDLSREALKYIERSRFFGEYPINRRLPGETEN